MCFFLFLFFSAVAALVSDQPAGPLRSAVAHRPRRGTRAQRRRRPPQSSHSPPDGQVPPPSVGHHVGDSAGRPVWPLLCLRLRHFSGARSPPSTGHLRRSQALPGRRDLPWRTSSGLCVGSTQTAALIGWHRTCRRLAGRLRRQQSQAVDL